MEEGLFKKYSTQIHNRNSTKKEIIEFIQKETNIFLKEEEIIITKKEVKITTTSTIKQKLHQKNLKEKLKEKGYILKQ